MHTAPIKEESAFMKKHPDKHIREALEYAEANGWDIVEAGKSAHAFCRLRCQTGHTEHMMSVEYTA
ncbi:MAG: hypothetical protein R3E67_02735 [Pseudomonadales bacterium]